MKNMRLVRKDESAVSPVIATILMVAITVVLAAVLYVMVSGLLTGPGASRPNITVGPVTSVGNPINGFTFQVAGAEPTAEAAQFRVNLGVNGTTGTAKTLAASVPLVVSGVTYTIVWTDPGGEGNVNGGDTFKVSRTGALTADTTYIFYLLWNDGATLRTAQYKTA